ncbi:MAG: prepilin peptidase [Atopobiaceae bacterium]|nr:prepilin peptidase [Atopobiaceae bacterium]MDD3177151.1 prepilin peptidase [Atopobiaceae bacterium]MDD4381585.1 prepilin peptidase [Atopobiaceae bacterium]
MLYATPLITVYSLAVTALLGLVMGSFLGCVAWRAVHGGSVLRGRSHCDSCGHVLGPADLVPVASWLALHGRCRYCGEHISARCPVGETLTAVVYVSIVARYDLTAQTIELLAFASVLVVLTLTDLDDRTIPNGCIVAALLIRAAYIGYVALTGGEALTLLTDSLVGAAAIGIPLLVIVLVMDRVLGQASMGGGDLKLLAVCGLYFGWQQSLLLVIVACVLGLVLALVPGLLPHDDEDDATTSGHGTFPFGPAIAVAAWLTMLCGAPIVTWYLGLF